MKMVPIAFAIASLAASSTSAGTPAAEIGYERGALGFEALLANDNETALRCSSRLKAFHTMILPG